MSITRLRRAAVAAAFLLVASAVVAPSRVAASVGVQPPPSPVVVGDLMRLRSITAVDVSEDGRRILYAVRGAVWADAPPGETPGPGDETTTVQHLWLVDLAGDEPAAPRRLTSGDVRDGAPVISPDGRSVAFVRTGEASDGWDGLPAAREEEGDPEQASQVWIMPLDGGEAVQATWFRHGASTPRWSEDGARLLVAAPVPVGAIEGTPPWPDDRPGSEAWTGLDDVEAGATPDGTRRELRRWLRERADDRDPRVITRLDFQDERGLAGPPMRARAAIVELPAGLLGAAAGGAGGGDAAAGDAAPSVQWATRGFDDARSPRWMSGGDRIVFVAPSDPRVHPDRVERRILASSSGQGLEVRTLVDLPDWTVGRPRPGPGNRLAFAARRMDHPSDRQWQVGLVDLDEVELPVRDAADVQWLTDAESFDHSVRGLAWHAGRVLLTAAVRGGFPLCAASPGLIEPTVLVGERDGFPVGVHAFGAGGGTIAWAETHPTAPSVLRVRAGDRDRLVHDVNPWVAERDVSLPRRAVVERPGGLEVEYWVMEPVGLAPREQAPLVLQIHGGPSAMWGPGEATMWHEFQVLCGWGYGVVYANPRGSGGYGYAFQRANFQDWGQGPAGDVLAALDEATALDWVDPDRLMLTGGSYGGYLVAWILGNDRRFTAAVAQRGVYHLATFYGEGNAWRLLEWEMGGKPWEARMDAILRRESPFTYVADMRTPLLIMHADRDLRTGVSQSEMLYRALRDLGRPVEYVRWPEAGHDLSRTGDPARRMDRLARIVEFFERFADSRRSAPRRGD